MTEPPPVDGNSTSTLQRPRAARLGSTVQRVSIESARKRWRVVIVSASSRVTATASSVRNGPAYGRRG